MKSVTVSFSKQKEIQSRLLFRNLLTTLETAWTKRLLQPIVAGTRSDLGLFLKLRYLCVPNRIFLLFVSGSVWTSGSSLSTICSE
ncbi:hypothetical protein CEXT_716421 [Caerostris extrusa]|uniref:Uncharacterized protein n=1 Tax=Caerostris extrusa TaxID=172846 RepID=A0AAV4XDZ1_CAEEX|nr:hypothetical protein CEXT_716421 [Caerostris extrusa]